MRCYTSMYLDALRFYGFNHVHAAVHGTIHIKLLYANIYDITILTTAASLPNTVYYVFTFHILWYWTVHDECVTVSFYCCTYSVIYSFKYVLRYKSTTIFISAVTLNCSRCTYSDTTLCLTDCNTALALYVTCCGIKILLTWNWWAGYDVSAARKQFELYNLSHCAHGFPTWLHSTKINLIIFRLIFQPDDKVIKFTREI